MVVANATATDRDRLVRPRAWAVGAAALALGATQMALTALRHPHQLFYDDATLYRIVARNPFGNGSALRWGAATYGVAYRYGRVGYPLVAWLLALGQPRFVGWTMALVSLASYAAVAAMAAELCARRGRHVSVGLVVLAAPVMTISMGVLFAEPTVIALILLIYLLWIDGRRGAAIAVGAVLPLVRETAALALLPLFIDSATRRNRAEIRGFVLAALPYLAWSTLIRVRMGHWPFLERSLASRDALGPPIVAYVTTPRFELMIVALVTVAAAVWLHRHHPWHPVTAGALLFSVLIIFLGPQAMLHPGGGLRVMGPAHALILVAAAGQLVPSRPHRS